MLMFALYRADGTVYPKPLPAKDLETAERAAEVLSQGHGQKFTVRLLNRKTRRTLKIANP